MTSTAPSSEKLFKAISPLQNLFSLGIDNIEKLAELQMSSTKVYSDIAYRQMRKVATIADMDDASEFTWDQIEPISEINKQLLNDWKSLIALHNDCKAGVIQAITPKTAEAETPTQAMAAAEETPKTSTKSKAASKSKTSKKASSEKAPASDEGQ